MNRVRPLSATLLACAFGVEALLFFSRLYTTEVTELGYLFLFLLLFLIMVLGLVKGYIVAWVLTLNYSGLLLLFTILGFSTGQILGMINLFLILVLGLAGPSRRYYLKKEVLLEDEEHIEIPPSSSKIIIRIIIGSGLLYVAYNMLTFLVVIWAVFNR